MAVHFDVAAGLAVETMLAPAVIAADNTPVAFDLAGFNGAAVLIQAGVGGITFDATNKIEFKLLHGDTSTIAQMTGVTADDVTNVASVGAGGIVRSLVAAKAAADSRPTKIGYRGSKRYVALLADFSGTHGVGTSIAAFLVKGRPHIVPAA